MERARRELVEELENLAAHKGYRVVVVFDADRRDGATDAATKTKSGVWEVYSVSNDADSWIERASIEELSGRSSVEKVLNEARRTSSGRVALSSMDESDAAGSADDGDENTPGSTFAAAKAKRLVYVATSDVALSTVGPRERRVRDQQRVSHRGDHRRAEFGDGNFTRPRGESEVGRGEARLGRRRERLRDRG